MSSSLQSTSQYSIVSRLQKNVIGKLSRRGIVQYFGSESLATFVDEFLHLLLTYYQPNIAEKIVKNVLKLSIKIALLERSDTNVLSEEGEFREHIWHIENRIQFLALIISSFQTVKYSYDYEFLYDSLMALKSAVKEVVLKNLSRKSMERLEFVFDHLACRPFTDHIFLSTLKSSESGECLQRFCSQLDKFSLNNR